MPALSLCGTLGANTGPISCDKRRGVPVVPMIGGKAFTPAEYADSTTFQAALIATINLPNGDPDKIYPFPQIQNVTDNTEENTTGTTGLGFQMILREGKPIYTFGVLVGSALEKQLRKFNNQIVPVWIFDNAADVCGTQNSEGNFVGTDALIFTEGKPYSDGNSIDTEYTNVTVSFLSAIDFFDNFAFVKTSFNTTALEGLLDATLYQAAVPAANVFKIGAKVKTAQLGGDINLYDKYADELAVAALWKAATGVGFPTAQTITSVAKDDALKCWTVTYDSVTFNALPANAQIQQKWDTPAVLLAAGVRGLESIPVIVTKA